MDDVIVVGAGPTGLTAAIELARRGVGVRVLDGLDGPHRGSRGKGMQPRTLELLDQLGVTDRLVSLGTFDLPIRHHGADGSVRDVERDPATAPDPTTPWPRTMLVPQWRTEEVLRDRLAEEGVSVEFGRSIAAVHQDADGVDLELADGERFRAAWVVGADGGSSAVRRELGVGFLGETREEVRMLLGDAEIDGLDRDHWHMWAADGPLTGGSFFALCPLPAATTWQIQIANTDRERRATPELLTDLIEGLGPRIHVRRADVVSDWRLNVRMVDDYRVGRVFLAGDAAHVHSPAGAQGMNTGIGDAVNLGWKLAAVVHGADPALLDSYTAERLPVAAHVLGLSNELTQGQLGQRTDEQIRDTRGFGISYRTLPDEGRGPLAGDRAPDAPLAGGDTLFGLRRRADWTVLAFGGVAEPPELPGGSVQVLDADALDVDGVLRATYRPADGEVVVLRPDGYVWSRGRIATPVS